MTIRLAGYPPIFGDSWTEWEQNGTMLAIVDSVAGQGSRLFCPDRTGGYFCVAYAYSGLPILIAEIGNPPADKVERYLTFAQEKAKRLAENPDHKSSWQSRDETKDQWGGAIRAGRYILSFSGFPELVDEAVMLLTALKWDKRFGGYNGDAIHQDVDEAAKASNNPHFAELLAVY